MDQVDGSGARNRRRQEALTEGRIVAEAIRVLDEGGAEALTFRTLAARLATGPGAIYHHVANKGELLAVATDAVLVEALDRFAPDEPDAGVRTVMLAAFDTLVAHPWVGSQMAAAPWQPAVLTLFDRIGSRLTAAGVPEAAQFDCASVLVHHVLGVAGQYDAAARSAQVTAGRATFISTATARAHAQGGDHAFLGRMESRLAQHDDRDQFRTGMEIILSGVAAFSRAPASGRLRATTSDQGDEREPWTP